MEIQEDCVKAPNLQRAGWVHGDVGHGLLQPKEIKVWTGAERMDWRGQ